MLHLHVLLGIDEFEIGGDDVGDAWSGGHGAHAGLAGDASPAVGGVPRRLLVPHVDDADPFVEAAVVDGLDVPSAEGKKVRRSVALEGLGDEFPGNTFVRPDDPRIAVVWGHRREMHPEASLYNRILDLDWIYEPGLTEFCGGDALMRRVAVQRAGGFNPDLIAGEEPDLCRRIRANGELILHIDAPMTGHDLAMTNWREYWMRAVRGGYAYAEIAALYRNTSDPLWASTSRSNVIRACIYVIAPAAAILIALVLRSWVAILLFLFCAAALIGRTAIRARRKHGSFATLILFAVHSHVQHIPVFVGQLRYRTIAGRHGRSELIEYKRPA